MKPRENGHDAKQKKLSNVSELIQGWLNKLAVHFNATLDEEQISIFVHALRDASPYQIATAFGRCLNESEFMPRLAQVHQRMPEERERMVDYRFLTKKPILDLVRPIAEEICKGMTGREYAELDTVRDQNLIHDIFAQANRTRLERKIFE